MTSLRPLSELGLLELGVSVWSRERRWAGSGGYPLGGIVVAFHDKADPDTGEIERSFQVVEWMRGKAVSHVLTLAEIDPELIKPFNAANARSVVRRLWNEGAQSKGPFTHREADIAKWTRTLVGLIL